MSKCWLLLLLIFTTSLSMTFAGDAATLGTIVPEEKRIAIDQIDHSQWDDLLRTYCDTEGMVAYRSWKDSSKDQKLLDQYLAHLTSADTTKPSSRDSLLSFWINAYNALTIKGILREYPTSSIRNHTARFFGYNIWDDLLLPVGNRTYSLNQIEHEVLRKMNEARIHFAIVCASKGCPPLLNQAYSAEQIDSQLTNNAKRFFADKSKFSANVSRNEIAVSPILDWFAEDFGDSKMAQMRRIALYLPNEESRALANSGKASVRYLDYDWSLNDQAN